MGLLDGILGNVAGSMLGGKQQAQEPLGTVLSGLAGGNARAGGSNPLLQIVLSLLQQNGGLEEVLGKFREGGLGAQADSWGAPVPTWGFRRHSSRRFSALLLWTGSLLNSACRRSKRARQCRRSCRNWSIN